MPTYLPDVGVGGVTLEVLIRRVRDILRDINGLQSVARRIEPEHLGRSTGVFLAKCEPTVMQAERGDRAQVRCTVDRLRTTEPHFRTTVRKIKDRPKSCPTERSQTQTKADVVHRPSVTRRRNSSQLGMG